MKDTLLVHRWQNGPASFLPLFFPNGSVCSWSIWPLVTLVWLVKFRGKDKIEPRTHSALEVSRWTFECKIYKNSVVATSRVVNVRAVWIESLDSVQQGVTSAISYLVLTQLVDSKLTAIIWWLVNEFLRELLSVLCCVCILNAPHEDWTINFVKTLEKVNVHWWSQPGLILAILAVFRIPLHYRGWFNNSILFLGIKSLTFRLFIRKIHPSVCVCVEGQNEDVPAISHWWKRWSN